MKFLAISDLHFDMWDAKGLNPFVGLEADMGSLDALILAGDISNKAHKRWGNIFEFLATMIDPSKIFVFPGNHDFYGYRIDYEDKLAAIASEWGVNYVNETSFFLGGVKFICATLWTDLEAGPGLASNKLHLPDKMNDYSSIKKACAGFRAISPSDIIEIHERHKAFIETELAAGGAETTVVVTHHVPLLSVLGESSIGYDGAYASDLAATIEAGSADLWLYGHSHDATGATFGSTSLENIALGYPGEVDNPKDRILSLIKNF